LQRDTKILSIKLVEIQQFIQSLFKFKLLPFLGVCLCILLFSSPTIAQSSSKSGLIVQIAEGHIWENMSKKDHFTIYILGNEPDLVSKLKKVKTIKNFKLKVSSGDDMPTNNHNLVFVTAKKKSIIPQLYQKFNNKPVLIVSEKYNKEQYVMVNINRNESGFDFIINEFNVYKQGIKTDKKTLNISGKQLNLPKIFDNLVKELANEKSELSDKLDELEMQGFEIESQKKKLNDKKKEVVMQEMALNSQQEGLNMFLSEINEKEEMLTKKEIRLQDNIYLLENQKIILEQKEYLIQIKIEENNKQKRELSVQKSELQAQLDTISTKNLTIGTQGGRIEKQKYMIFGGIASLSLFAILIFFILRGYRIKQRTNLQLEEKQNEIFQQAEELMTSNNALSEQKDILEEKNSEIKASLNYALTIQQSILPIDDLLATKFEYFYIYKPKDIVSGDFYWFTEVNNANVNYKYIAVSDCTGHGVPGAFMSLIGSRILDEIVTKSKVYNTQEILDQLHKEIVTSLKQDKTDNSDGMDITLVRLENDKNGQTNIQFTAAKHNLFIYHNSDKSIEKIRGDQKGIGGNFYDHVDFTHKNLTLSSGDSIYMLSDGIPDQCSLARKKFRGTGMAQMLKKATALPYSDQKECLENDLNRFMTYEDQIDDLTLFSVKL